MNNRGRLIIISGLSGAGKGTIVRRLLEKYPEDYVLSVSVTTRKPREGEVHGKDYFFITTEEFETMISGEELLEYARYVNHYYGTPKGWVENQMADNKNVILEIEIQGAFQVKDLIGDSVLIFILPPSMEELKQRLVKRGTETESQIEERLTRAREEMKYVNRYDYVIVNEDVEKSVDMLHTITLGLKNKEN